MRAPTPAEITDTLGSLHARHLSLRDGHVASYIPELSKADPAAFGIAVATVDGQVFTAGDADSPFTLQSVSKPFVYGLALEDHGRDGVLARVGVEPTGDAFNSIIELERRSHRPYNPMVNSGAIAITGMIRGESPADKLNRILAMLQAYSGRPVQVDMPVFVSERNTGHRNRAIAHLLRHFDAVGPEIDTVLDLYFQQCAALTSARSLAVMAATLANAGVNPATGLRAIRPEHTRDLLSIMFSCGMYDSSGEWAYTVGLPAKSGVSGGILAVVPGVMGLAAYSPPLDEFGHSVRGVAVLRELSERWKLGVFEPRSSYE